MPMRCSDRGMVDSRMATRERHMVPPYLDLRGHDSNNFCSMLSRVHVVLVGIHGIDADAQLAYTLKLHSITVRPERIPFSLDREDQPPRQPVFCQLAD